MTDRECLLQLAASLGLKEAPDKQPCSLGAQEFVEDDVGIAIGAGEGYCCFWFEVEFDETGKAIGHGVWE